LFVILRGRALGGSKDLWTLSGLAALPAECGSSLGAKPRRLRMTVFGDAALFVQLMQLHLRHELGICLPGIASLQSTRGWGALLNGLCRGVRLVRPPAASASGA